MGSFSTTAAEPRGWHKSRRINRKRAMTKGKKGEEMGSFRSFRIFCFHGSDGPWTPKSKLLQLPYNTGELGNRVGQNVSC